MTRLSGVYVSYVGTGQLQINYSSGEVFYICDGTYNYVTKFSDEEMNAEKDLEFVCGDWIIIFNPAQSMPRIYKKSMYYYSKKDTVIVPQNMYMQPTKVDSLTVSNSTINMPDAKYLASLAPPKIPELDKMTDEMLDKEFEPESPPVLPKVLIRENVPPSRKYI